MLKGENQNKSPSDKPHFEKMKHHGILAGGYQLFHMECSNPVKDYKLKTEKPKRNTNYWDLE